MELHPASVITKCPRCSSHRLYRHGTTRSGEQRYMCIACNRTCTRFSNSVGSHVRKRFAFQRFLSKMHKANSVRQDADMLGVAPSTVWRWRHHVIRFYADRRAKERLHWQGDAVATAEVINRRRRYWGGTFELFWAKRHNLAAEWASEQGRGVPGTMVHFITEVRPDNQPGDLSIEIGEGSKLHPCVPKPFIARSNTRPKYWKSIGLDFLPVSYESKPDDLVRISKRPRMAPSYHWRLRCQKIVDSRFASPEMRKASSKASELRNLFLYWSSRFRGVSLQYLSKYTAWFMEELKSHRLKVSGWMYPNLAGLESPQMGKFAVPHRKAASPNFA